MVQTFTLSEIFPKMQQLTCFEIQNHNCNFFPMTHFGTSVIIIISLNIFWTKLRLPNTIIEEHNFLELLQGSIRGYGK